MKSYYINRQILKQSNGVLSILFIIFSLLDSCSSQDNGIQLFYNIQAFHFRRQTNPDFGIQLGSLSTNGVVTNNLGADGYPEYCCGDQSKYTMDGRTLLVNNASTFSEWWRGSINQAQCENYGLLLPLVLGEYTQNGGYFYTTPDYIRGALTGRGFNNYNEYPQYQSDGDVYSFCWRTELDYKYIPGSNYIGSISVIYPGEILVYIDGVLRISRIGVTSVGNQLISVRGQEGDDQKHHVVIFGCDRASNSLWEINIRFFDVIAMCDVNACGTCGYSVCPETCNNVTSCRNLRPICGSCQDDGPKDCELENDHSDPCVMYTCVEGTGCVPQIIPGCQCSSTNCVSDDLCMVAECEGNKCVKKMIDCSNVFPNCNFTNCVKGKCICSDIVTPVTSTTTTESSTARVTTTQTMSTLLPATTGVPTTISTSIPTTTPSTFNTIVTPTPDLQTTAQTTIHPPPLTVTTLYPTITTESSIISTTSIFSSIISSSMATTTTSNPYLCDEYSCPSGYFCIQLNSAYSCVSSHFDNECYSERLKDFY